MTDRLGKLGTVISLVLSVSVLVVFAASVSAADARYAVDLVGGKLVDQSGSGVTLVGMNYGDHPRNFKSADFSADAKRIREAGFTSVMFTKEWGSLENGKDPSDFSYNETEMLTMMQQIGNLTENGINVVIKLHADYDKEKNGKNLQQFLGNQYCNQPGNYSSRFSENFYNTSYLKDKATGQSHLLSLWLKISQMTRNNPNVIGFDLMNEPTYCEYEYKVGTRVHDGWHDRVSEIIEALRKDGDNRIVFVEEAPFFEFYSRFKPWTDPKVVSSIHWYRGVQDHTETGSYRACWSDYSTLSGLWSDTDAPGLEACTNSAMGIKQAQEKYPDQLFMVTEFGDIFGNKAGDGNETWINNSVRLFKDSGVIGWFYWSSGETGTWIKNLMETAPPKSAISASKFYFLSSMGGETTKLNSLDERSLASIPSLIFHVPKSGKIRYLEPVNMTMATGVENYNLEFEGLDYDIFNEVTVNVNGKNVTSLPNSGPFIENPLALNDIWSKFSVDITNFVKQGENTITFIKNDGWSGVANLTVSGKYGYSFKNSAPKYTTGIPSIGYTFSVDSIRVDLDSYVKISPLRISVDTSKLPFLNRSARIVFEKVSLSNPRILKDGEPCGDSCVLEVYNRTSENLIYKVSGFSTYTIEETPSQASAPSSGGGGGGGSYYGGSPGPSAEISSVTEMNGTNETQPTVSTAQPEITQPVVEESIPQITEDVTAETETSDTVSTQGISGMAVAIVASPWTIVAVIAVLSIYAIFRIGKFYRRKKYESLKI